VILHVGPCVGRRTGRTQFLRGRHCEDCEGELLGNRSSWMLAYHRNEIRNERTSSMRSDIAHHSWGLRKQIIQIISLLFPKTITENTFASAALHIV